LRFFRIPRQKDADRKPGGPRYALIIKKGAGGDTGATAEAVTVICKPHE